MPLELQFRDVNRWPVDARGLNPAALRGKPLREIERLPIQSGNRQVPLAELFAVAGDASDNRIEFTGRLTSVHGIGAGMADGEITVNGDVGCHAGAEMTGGTLTIRGNADLYLGAHLRGGVIRLSGRAGDFAGGAYPGSAKAMRGGELLIEGDAGRDVGRGMRRGLIAVRGSVGSFVGNHMLAGSILIFGSCGPRAGAGMRRGTIAALGDERPTLLPTFRHACRYEPVFLQLMLNRLKELGFQVPQLPTRCELFHGDLLMLGRGELLTRAG